MIGMTLSKRRFSNLFCFYCFAVMLFGAGFGSGGTAAAAPAAATMETRALDLAEVVRLAGERSPEAVIANETAMQAMERYVQARSPLLPQIDGNFSAVRQTRNLESVGIRSTASAASGGSSSPVTEPFTVLDARVSAVQRIFDLGAVRRWELAARERALTQSQIDKARQDVMALAATLFIDARRTRDALQAAKAVLMWARTRERLVRDQVRTGLAAESDGWLARSDLADARAQVHLFRSSVYGKLMELNAVLGWEPRTAWEFKDEDRPLSRIWRGEGDGTGSDLMIARRRSDRAEVLKRAADANFFPQVLFTADYGANGDDWDGLEDTYSFGVTVKAPFFEGGLRQSQASEAASALREARLRLEDAQRRDRYRRLDARRRISDARMQLMAQTAGVKYRAVILELIRSRFATGQGSEIDVLEALAGLARAEDGRSEARAALDQARVEVAHAEGKMMEWIAEGDEA